MRTYSATIAQRRAWPSGRQKIEGAPLNNVVAVNLDADTYARLVALAEREGIPVGRAARGLIKIALSAEPS